MLDGELFVTGWAMDEAPAVHVETGTCDASVGLAAIIMACEGVTADCMEGAAMSADAELGDTGDGRKCIAPSRPLGGFPGVAATSGLRADQCENFTIVPDMCET